MSPSRRVLGVGSLTALVAAAVLASPAHAAPSDAPLARVQDFLAGQLGSLGSASTTVLVHGTDIAAARAAVEATGMRPVTEFERIGVAVASGTAG